MRSPELKFYKLNHKPARLLQKAAVLAVAAMVLLQSAMVSVLLCWLLLLIAVAGMVAGLLRLLEQRPQLVIYSQGISGEVVQRRLIRWEQVQEANLQEEAGEVYLHLLATEYSQPAQAPGKGGDLKEYKLPLSHLQVAASELLDLLRQVLRYPVEHRTAAATKALPAFKPQQASPDRRLQNAVTANPALTESVQVQHT